jgi:hypothetical protein
MAGPYTNVRELWRPMFALVGRHVTTENFDVGHIEFDYLAAWASPPALTAFSSSETGTYSMAPTELGRATIEESDVILMARVTGEAGSRRIDLTPRCTFEVRPVGAPLTEFVNFWVRMLQDLLIVSLGRPVRLVSLRVGMNEIPAPETATAPTRQWSADLIFNDIGRTATDKPVRSEVETFTEPTLVTRQTLPIPLESLITGWARVFREHHGRIVRLTSSYHAPFVYSEHRYAAQFQAAEGLAKSLASSNKELSRSEHKQRVDKVRAALEDAGFDDRDVEWATGALRSRNDKPFRQLINDFAVATGDLGGDILAATPKFGHRAASARVAVSHDGSTKSAIPERYWLGDALEWLVRVRLLAEAGIDIAHLVEQGRTRGAFKHTLEQLSEERLDTSEPRSPSRDP